VGLGAGLLATVCFAPTASATSVHVSYVAGARWGSGAEYVTEQAGVTVTGTLRFRPVHSTIRMRIDDKGALDGQTVAVLGLHRNVWTCVPVRRTVTLSGFRPGELVIASIEGDRVWTSSGCTAHALAGVVDVEL
jgi:hypothetical protein